MPELNARSLTLGIAIGVCLGVGNVYLGLKIGFWDSGAITATILGYTFLSLRARGASAGETNVIQALAASVATVPSVMGLFGAIPALELMGRAVAPATLLAWALALGLLGALLGLVLRATFIDREALPFPTGRAVATLIRALHAQAAVARSQTRTLLLAAAVTAAIVWLRDGRLAWIPGLLVSPWAPAAVPAAAALIGLQVSPVLAATGAIIGPRVGLSALGGAVLAWLIVAPRLVERGLATAGYDALSVWLLWPGAGLLVGGGLAALALEWKSFARLAGDLRSLARRGAAPWLAAALVAGAGVVAVARLGLDVPVVLAILGLLVAVPLIAAFVRTVGQTDVAHYAALGQVTQGTLAALDPAPAVANVAAAAIAAGAAPGSVQLLYTLRVARELDAPPRPLVAAHLIGLGVGAVVALVAYTLLVRAHGVGSAALPAPFAATWKAMGLVAERGVAAMPPGALVGTVAALAAGVALALLERTRLARFVPSPTAAGVGFLVQFGASAAIAVGAVLGGVLAARAAAFSDRHLLPAASGVIAGESLAAVVLALVASAV